MKRNTAEKFAAKRAAKAEQNRTATEGEIWKLGFRDLMLSVGGVQRTCSGV